MKKEIKILFYLFLILFGMIAVTENVFAAGGAHSEGIPYKTIMFQAINLSMLVGLLVYLLKKPLKLFFTEKKQNFLKAAEKAEQIQKIAEQEHLQIKVRLTKLQSTSDESIAKARAEASDLKKQLIAEAQATAKRVELETKTTIELELTKAKQQLREQLIQEAILLSRSSISSKVSVEDHKRLEGDFIKNIGVLN
jgi:F-type H+-transporting ATPase subunit b